MTFSLFQRVGQAFIHLAYPALCLHCEAKLESLNSIFCSECMPLLERIDLSERCPFCCSPLLGNLQRICQECNGKEPILNGMIAAFDYRGPPASFIRKFKYGDQPYLAKGAAAYMALQLIELEEPLPDIIVPVPLSFTHWLIRGYNQSLLLAEELGKFINRPVYDVLGRKSGDYSQARLNRKMRLQNEGNTLYLKKEEDLLGKRILLIDDVATTGSTLKKCGEILQSGYPKSIFGLVFCRAV